MKYTIEGLGQARLVGWGLDAADAVILRWFADFYHGSKMTVLRHDGKEFKWLKYQHVIDELPICGIKDRDAMANRFKRYTACGIMELLVWRVGGVFTYFRINPEKWDELVSDPVSKPCIPCAEAVDNQGTSPIEIGKVPHWNGEGSPSKWGTNDSSSNSSINKNKEEAACG